MRLRLRSKLEERVRSVTTTMPYVRRTKETFVHIHMGAPVETKQAKSFFDELLKTTFLTDGYNDISRGLCLEH